MQQKRIKIALFYPYPNIDTNPTVVEIIKLLSHNNYQVDIFTFFTNNFLFPSWKNENIRIIVNQNLYSEENDGFQSFAESDLHHSYSMTIGCDPDGIVVANYYARKYKIPLVYMSFEIFFMDELQQKNDIQLKKNEIEASNNAELIVIQDEQRAQLLSIENGIDKSKFILIPVSPKGNGRSVKSTFFKDKFNLNKDRIVVLHSGEFKKRTLGHELVESAQNWSNEFFLVIHTRSRTENNSYLLEAQEKSNPSKVGFSTEPFAYDEYDASVSSADIGLVIQNQMKTKFCQKNVSNIGLASGKLSFYAKYGKPLITNRLETYRQLFEEYPAGKIFDRFEDVNNILKEISHNYNLIADSCYKLYEEKLDFTLYESDFLNRIKSLL